MKTIIHIDIDAFFTSAEELRNNELKYIPIAVSNSIRDGIISTSNYIARKYNVFSAMNNNKALMLCPNLKIIKADMDYYKELSKRFFEFICKNISDQIEISSIDECFIDITNQLKDYDNNVFLFCSDLKNKIRNHFNLNISIGCGPNKYIAKILTNLSKPNGLLIYDKNKFYNNDIRELNHISSEKLNYFYNQKILTFSDFINDKNSEIITKKITMNLYEKIKNFLMLKKFEPLTLNYNKPNQISYTYHFKPYSYDINEIELALKSCVNNLLKKEELKNYFYNTFILYYKQDNKLKTYNIKIDNYDNFYKIALNKFNKGWNEQQIEYIGVGLKNPIEEETNEYKQSTLFDC